MGQSVLKDWVMELPLMMQGTITTAIRGNDVAHAPTLKPLTRWLRSLILHNGNPENDFHLLHTIEIVGYMHPDDQVAEIALDYYARLVDWLHLEPELKENFESRLSGQPGTTGTQKKWVPFFARRQVAERLLAKTSEEQLVESATKILREKGYEVVGPEHRYMGRTGS